MYDACNKILGRFCVFLSNHTRAFGCLLPVLFRFLVGRGAIRMGTKYRRCRKDLIKILKLLACALFVGVDDSFIVDAGYVGEAVHDEGAQK